MRKWEYIHEWFLKTEDNSLNHLYSYRNESQCSLKMKRFWCLVKGMVTFWSMACSKSRTRLESLYWDWSWDLDGSRWGLWSVWSLRLKKIKDWAWFDGDMESLLTAAAVCIHAGMSCAKFASVVNCWELNRIAQSLVSFRSQTTLCSV